MLGWGAGGGGTLDATDEEDGGSSDEDEEAGAGADGAHPRPSGGDGRQAGRGAPKRRKRATGGGGGGAAAQGWGRSEWPTLLELTATHSEAMELVGLLTDGGAASGGAALDGALRGLPADRCAPPFGVAQDGQAAMLYAERLLERAMAKARTAGNLQQRDRELLLAGSGVSMAAKLVTLQLAAGGGDGAYAAGGGVAREGAAAAAVAAVAAVAAAAAGGAAAAGRGVAGFSRSM